VPRSRQLLAELSRQAPDIPLEVAWRFDPVLKGKAVDIVQNGRAVRRAPASVDKELVVLGDGPLFNTPAVQSAASNSGGATKKAPYLEIRLDELTDFDGARVNDFGVGVTACNPEEDIGTLGSVADEVPRSWIVDFTRSFVGLSVSNEDAARGENISAEELMEGDRVGLRFPEDGAVEVFINGVLRERLVPRSEVRVPTTVALVPVLDMYGRVVQVSRTDADEPLR